MGVKRLWRAFLVAMAIAAAWPSTGVAARALVSAEFFVYVAAAGEENDVEMGEDGGIVTIRDSGAVITAEEGCVQVTAHEARCTSVHRSSLFLGDLNDTATVLEGGNPTVRGGDPTIRGGDGNDTISGCPRCRLFAAGEVGDDVITANAFLVTGGGGNDTITGGDSPNRMNGGPGNDTLSGLGGHDFLLPGSGDDFVHGGPGADLLNLARSQPDSPVEVNLATGQSQGASQGTDTLVSIRHVWATDASDRLVGDGQGNLFKGGSGDDVLIGGEGDDILMGAWGHDRLRGGAGNDGFRARDGLRDIVKGGLGRDWARVDRGLDQVMGIQVFR